MKRSRFGSLLSLLILTVVGFVNGPGLVTAGDAVHTRRNQTGRPAVVKPAAPQPPELLRVTPSTAATTEKQTAESRVMSAAMEERLAHTAQLRVYAHAAADNHIRRIGIQEYYRTGVWRGMRDALADTNVGVWDYRIGRQVGRLDPRARRLGRELGEQVAAEEGETLAADRVADQFHQLHENPQFNDRPPLAGLGAEFLPAVEAPTLELVLSELTFALFSSRRLTATFLDTDWTPWTLYNCDNYDRIYRNDWRDAANAWSRWRERPSHRHWINSFRFTENRRWAERAFREQFRFELDRLWEPLLLHAWQDGFDDGFEFGAWTRYEMAWREGFTTGSVEATERAAKSTFEKRFPFHYEDAYAHIFDAWNSGPHIELDDIVFTDADDDGVFTPGEELIAEVQLVNWGGGAGGTSVNLDGVPLQRSTLARAEMPARARAETALLMTATIDPTAAVRRDDVLELAVGDFITELPFRVAWPLEFSNAATVVSLDPVLGTLELEIPVSNISRRARGGRVGLEGFGDTQSAALERLDAGSTRSVRFLLENLRGSVLLDGSSGLDWSLTAAGHEQDSLEQRLPNYAVDLNSPWLTQYLESLAAGPRPDAEELERVHALAWQRLQSDWRRAIRRNNNPYKRDLKKNDNLTVVGDWAQRSRRTAVHSEVWGGLGELIVTRADTLPGAHPLLRKWLRKLAREIG